MTRSERAAAGTKLLGLNERFNQRALSVLNPSQRAKLTGIEARFLGATVLFSPSVQARLKLTDAQKREIEAIRQKGITYVGKVNRKFEEGKISQQERLQLLRSRRTAQVRRNASSADSRATEYRAGLGRREDRQLTLAGGLRENVPPEQKPLMASSLRQFSLSMVLRSFESDN